MKDNIRNEISYKFLEEHEIDGISRLIKSMKKDSDEVLNLRDNSIEYYRWMYFRNPAGNAIIASAWHNGVLVSTFAMAPKRAYIDGKEHLIGKTMDMFTDPDYQGLGIISKLTKMVFEESTKRGLEGWYVTPSGNSYPIFKNKWNYIEAFELLFRYRILDIKKMASAIIMSTPKKLAFKTAAFFIAPFINFRNGKKSDFEILQTEDYNKDFDVFWQDIEGEFDNILIRDSKYLNWRFAENPDTYKTYVLRAEGKIAGHVTVKETLRKGVKTGEIVDILVSRKSRDYGKALLRHAQSELYSSGCAICETWDFEGSMNTSLYTESGLSKTRAQVKFLLSPDCSIEGFYNKSRWHLTQSDGNDI